MVFNAATVGVAVTPTVLETTVSHVSMRSLQVRMIWNRKKTSQRILTKGEQYLHRRPRRGKPTAHLSYDAALNLIRQFLVYSSHHTVENVQAFTSQWVPAPSWVKLEDVTVPQDYVARAATYIQNQLGPKGVEEVGGPTWWQWRRDKKGLHAEWVEMKKDYNVRMKNGGKTQRSMLYVHGGGYYFGSVDEHRYQIQRHARKLQARVFCPRYRLSPQFPFPCGLLDCLAAYLFMLETQAPETIILAGDSAGGGMVLAMQLVMRDQGIPLPAGSILISPWVDLTHSFPSVAGDNPLDYIPPYGFHHRPSDAWPPPSSDDMKALEEVMVKAEDGRDISMRELKAQIAARAGKKKSEAAGYTIDESMGSSTAENGGQTPGVAENLSIVIDGVRVELKDQIQMYAPNSLLSHPLVSPVLQASLGGLPPMQVCVGGGEMLRDEQIYLAHKAANPAAYPAPATKYADKDAVDAAIAKYPPTRVQLQVWDDLCHVGPTLSFTRPAKFMFRGIAQFGAWALATAQRTTIRIMDDDEVSDIGSASSDDEAAGSKDTNGDDAQSSEREKRRKIYEDAVQANQNGTPAHKTLSAISLGTVIGKAGDPLPPFHKNMIRQRVTRHGDIYPLAPASEFPALNMSPENIGVIKTGPVRKWLNAHDEMNKKYASAKRRTQMRRLKQIKNTAAESMVFVKSDGEGGDENPPPAAMAGRKKSQLPKVTKRSVSMALGMWSGWNSKHDEEAISNEQDKIRDQEKVNMSVTTVRTKDQTAAAPNEQTQTEDSTLAAAAVATAPAGVAATDHTAPAVTSSAAVASSPADASSPAVAVVPAEASVPAGASDPAEPADPAKGQLANVESQRSQVGDGFVPFKVRPPLSERNPSTMTLSDESGVVSPDKSASPKLVAAESDITALPAAAAADRPVATAIVSSSSPKKLHKQNPSEQQKSGLQREQSTKSWARNVLRRSGFGSISRPRNKVSGEDTSPANGSAAAAVAASAPANAEKETHVPVAVDAGEIVNPETRPEPNRFKTAQEL